MKKNKIIATSLLGLFAVSSLASVNSFAAEAGRTTSKGSVSFDNSGGQTPTPVDPTDPNVPPAPIEPNGPGEGAGTDGLLRFDRVPNLAFAKLPVSNKSETVNVLEEKYKLTTAPSDGSAQEYYAAPTVEITDLTGSNSGWHAQVLVDEYFVDTADSNSKFVGQITFNKGRTASYSGQDAILTPTTPDTPLTLNQSPQTFVTAAEGNGAYQWGISYYTGDHQNSGKPKKNYTATPIEDEAVQLTVEPGQKVNLGTDHVYKTNLTWILNNTPA